MNKQSSTSLCFGSDIHDKTTQWPQYETVMEEISSKPLQLAVYIQPTVPKFSLPSHLRQHSPVAGDRCLGKAPRELKKIKILPMSNIKQACESVEGEQRTVFYRFTTVQVRNLSRI